MDNNNKKIRNCTKIIDALNIHNCSFTLCSLNQKLVEKTEDIPHSKVVGSSFDFNDQLRYECIKGYTLTGPRLRTCGNDGKWSEAPRCEGRSCPFILSCPRTFMNFLSHKKSLLKITSGYSLR